MQYLEGAWYREELRQREFRYRAMLRNCDLIGQLAISADELKEVSSLIDEAGISTGGERQQFATFCKTYAAVIAVFLTFSAVYEYVRKTANFWDGVWAQFQMKRTYPFQEIMGLTFTNFVKETGLIEFHGTPNIYVDPILLHATIPSQCLENFFEQVLMPLSMDPGNSLDDLGNLLRPVDNFLVKGGRVAEDFVNRSLQLYNALERGTGIHTGDASRVAEQFGLAVHVVEALVKWFPLRHTTPSGSGGRHIQPRLVLDPYELGLAMEFPPKLIQASYGVTASVAYGARIHTYEIQSHDGNSGFYRLPLYGPSREYVLNLSNGYSTSIRGIQIDRPYYFNVKTGRRLPFGLLPAGQILAVCPSNVIPRGDGSAQNLVLEELPPLLGNWGQAQVLTLNTKGHRHLSWLSENEEVPDWAEVIDTHAATLPYLVDGHQWCPKLVAPEMPTVYFGNAPGLHIPLAQGKLERYSIRIENRHTHTCFYDGPLAELGEALIDGINGVQVDLGAKRLLADAYGHIHLFLRGPLGSDTTLDFILLPEGFIELIPMPGSSETVDYHVLFGDCGENAKALIKVGQSWRAVEGLLSPPDDVSEVAIRCVSNGSIVAEFPLRIRKVEWRFVRDNQLDGGDWTWQSGQIALDGKETSNSYLLTRSYFKDGATHTLALYADGDEVQRLPSVSRDTVPQRNRFLVDTFFDAMQAHAAKELSLVLLVSANGKEQAILLAEMMFSWHISHLEVAVTEGPLISVSASWREHGRPVTERQIILHDNWRERDIQIPIAKNATRTQTSFLPEELPPARYSIGFSTKRSWTGKTRYPVTISPKLYLNIAGHSWRQVLNNADTPEEWLMVARALMCGCEVGLPEAPKSSYWQESELKALAMLLTSSRTNPAFPKLTRAVKGWSVEERLDLMTVASSYTKLCMRRVALALSLPRMLTPVHRELIDPEVFNLWPVLRYLAEPIPLLNVDGVRLEYAWGVGYKVRDPLAYGITRPLEELHPDRPSNILAMWLRAKGMQVLADENLEAIKEVRNNLSEQMDQLNKIAQKYSFDGRRGFSYGVKAIRHSLGSPDVIYSDSGTIAYVAASVALIQRLAAREPSLGGYFEKYHELESVCDYCFDLYDYYLYLAETTYKFKA